MVFYNEEARVTNSSLLGFWPHFKVKHGWPEIWNVGQEARKCITDSKRNIPQYYFQVRRYIRICSCDRLSQKHDTWKMTWAISTDILEGIKGS